MFVSDYISTNVFFSKWNFLHKFGKILSWVKIIIWRKNLKCFRIFFPIFSQCVFKFRELWMLYMWLHSDPHSGHNYEKILIILVNLLWSYQQWHSTHAIEISFILAYLWSWISGRTYKHDPMMQSLSSKHFRFHLS